MSPIPFETDLAKKLRLEREDANVKVMVDCSYTDLLFWVDNCRRLKDKESFDTSIRILEAIKKQVLGK